MAVKRVVTETRISDLSGVESEDVRSLRFSTNASGDNERYSIDATPEEFKNFLAAIEPFVTAAKAAKGAGNVSSNVTGDSGDENATIRQWGRDHGYDVSDRGRLSPSLQAAYYKWLSEPGNGDLNVDDDDDDDSENGEDATPENTSGKRKR